VITRPLEITPGGGKLGEIHHQVLVVLSADGIDDPVSHGDGLAVYLRRNENFWPSLSQDGSSQESGDQRGYDQLDTLLAGSNIT
jgi:hypothetical protein